MKVIENEMVAFVDVDGTLVHWDRDDLGQDLEISISFAGETVTLHEYHETVRFVRQLKERGYYLVAWSGNGFTHVDQVVKGLELEDCFDIAMSKPVVVIDDKAPNSWIKWIEVGTI